MEIPEELIEPKDFSQALENTLALIREGYQRIDEKVFLDHIMEGISEGNVTKEFDAFKDHFKRRLGFVSIEEFPREWTYYRNNSRVANIGASPVSIGESKYIVLFTDKDSISPYDKSSSPIYIEKVYDTQIEVYEFLENKVRGQSLKE